MEDQINMRQPTLADLKALERTFNALQSTNENCFGSNIGASIKADCYQHCRILVSALINECENDIMGDITL